MGLLLCRFLDHQASPWCTILFCVICFLMSAFELLLLVLLFAVHQDILWWALYKAEAVLLGSKLRKWALDEVRSCSCERAVARTHHWKVKLPLSINAPFRSRCICRLCCLV